MKRMFGRIMELFSQESIDRTISGGICGQFKLLARIILSILAIIFILILCLNLQVCDDGTIMERLWVVYNNFIDPGNLATQTGFANRFAMAITGLLGSVLLGGIFISMCSNIMERRVDAIRSGKVCYKSVKDHYVIIGCSNITVSLIKDLHKESPDTRILVMSGKESETVRHKLQAQLDKDEERNVYIYFGNIDSIEELGRLNVGQAKEVYILGDEGDYGRDSKNIQCVHSISTLKGKVVCGNELPVYTQFDRLSAYSVIQKFDIMNVGGTREPGSDKVPSNIYFRPFNLYENWARRLWGLYAVDDEYDSLDYDPICFQADGSMKNADKYVHLVIVGFSNMGQALLLQALRVCHYANYDELMDSESRVRTIVTVVDKNIDELKEHFKSQYPCLDEQVDDIRINYLEENITGSSMRKDLADWSEDPEQLLTVALCISDPDECISLGLNLPREVYESDARVLIRQEMQTDLGQIIHRDEGRYRNVKVFGMLEDCISKDMLRDEMAAYINQEYEDVFKSDGQKEYIKPLYHHKLDDNREELEKEVARARVSWINLEENMRWANRYQVDSFRTFLGTLGLKVVRKQDDRQNGMTPDEFNKSLGDKKLTVLMRMEKRRWNAERTIEGWKYGAVKDDVYRVHPLIVPYGRLSEEEKAKDKQVIVALPYLISLAGYKIVPSGIS